VPEPGREVRVRVHAKLQIVGSPGGGFKVTVDDFELTPF
jgi:hypothetical protein